MFVADNNPMSLLWNKFVNGEDPDFSKEHIPEWDRYNRLGSTAVAQAGVPAQVGEFGASILPDAATAVATRGMSLAPRLGANAASPFLTTEGDIYGRGTAGLLGGGGYALGTLAGGVTKAGHNVAQTFKEPFTPDGRMRLVRNVLEEQSSYPKTLAKSVANPDKPLLDGYKYSLAESIPGDQGLAQLQRTAVSSNPFFQKYLTSLQNRQNRVIERNLSEMSGATVNPKTKMTAYDTAVENRKRNAHVNYGAAENTPLVFGKSAEKRAKDLLSRPLIQESIAPARRYAQNLKLPMHPEGSFQGMQQMRQFLSDKMGKLNDPASGASFFEKNEVAVVLRELDKFLAKSSPEFGKAQKAYKQDSIPINQMDVANLLRQKMLPPANEFMDAPFRLTPASYQRALVDRGGRDLDDARSVVKQATGMNKPLSEVMNGKQLYTIESIGKETARRQKVQGAIKPAGESITAQLTGQQDILDRLAFPFLPSKWAVPASRIVGDYLGTNVEEAAKLTQRSLARALVDSRYANKALSTPKLVNPYEKSPLKWGIYGAGAGNSLDYYVQD